MTSIGTTADELAINSGILKRGIKYAFAAFLYLRLMSSLLLLFFAIFFPAFVEPSNADTAQALHELETSSMTSKILLAPWYRWDSVHYIDIAEQGYSANPMYTVWPPFYPLLTRWVSSFVSPTLLAAIIVSNLAAVAAFFLFYLLGTELWGEATARSALVWLTFYPMAFFMVAAYSESTFLALSLGSLLAFRRRKWILSGLLGAAAALTRIQGVVLVIPMVWEVFCIVRRREARWFQRSAAASTPILVTTAALLTYFSYVRFVMDAPWPWVTLGVYWNQHMGWPWEGILGNLASLTFGQVNTPPSPITRFADLVLICGAFVVLLVQVRKIPTGYWLYSLAGVLIILTKVDNRHLLMSVSRYLLPFFPVFVALAMSLKKSSSLIWFAISAAGQFLFLVMFFWWMWVA